VSVVIQLFGGIDCGSCDNCRGSGYATVAFNCDSARGRGSDCGGSSAVVATVCGAGGNGCG